MLRFLILILMVLSACGTSPAPPAPSALRLAVNAAPTTLDPRKSGDFISSTLICMVYDGLTRCVPGEEEVELAAADKIDISQDGCVYTFHLRKSNWSDGHPVVAQDFERSWKKIVDPSFSALCAYLLFPIKNAERCVKGEVSIDEVGVRALDSHTLSVELERPTPYFLSLTAFPLFLPIPSHLHEHTPTVCNGPYRIASHISNNEILLKKNASYWNNRQISIEEIWIHVIPDENTALQMFERGEIDWLGAPLAPLPPDALYHHSEKLRFIPMAASTIIAFNTQSFPFQNKNLRKALSLSLDRQQIVKEITLLGQIPASRCLPPSLFPEELPPLFGDADRDAARALFEEALSELQIDKADLESITLYYKPGQVEKRLAQTLQREWEEAFGFTLNIEQLEPKTHMQKLHARGFQIALSSWISQFHDPVNILERFRLPTNPKNYAGWQNDRYAALLNQAASTLEPSKRLDLLAEAEEIFASELPVFPLYHWTSPSLAHPRVKEIASTPSGGILFEKFELERGVQ